MGCEELGNLVLFAPGSRIPHREAAAWLCFWVASRPCLHGLARGGVLAPERTGPCKLFQLASCCRMQKATIDEMDKAGVTS